MPIAKLTLEVELPFAHSLKDRRQVVRSLKDSLRRGFNLSTAELDETPLYNRATIAAVAIHRSRSYLEGQMDQAERAARRGVARYGAEIIASDFEWMEETEAQLPHHPLS